MTSPRRAGHYGTTPPIPRATPPTSHPNPGPVLAAVLADIDPDIVDTPLGAMTLALAGSMDDYATAATARELRHCLAALEARRNAVDTNALLAEILSGPVPTPSPET
jgi:hypothetical protein